MMPSTTTVEGIPLKKRSGSLFVESLFRIFGNVRPENFGNANVGRWEAGFHALPTTTL